jgi:hypothetical protein
MQGKIEGLFAAVAQVTKTLVFVTLNQIKDSILMSTTRKLMNTLKDKTALEKVEPNNCLLIGSMGCERRAASIRNKANERSLSQHHVQLLCH